MQAQLLSFKPNGAFPKKTATDMGNLFNLGEESQEQFSLRSEPSHIEGSISKPTGV